MPCLNDRMKKVLFISPQPFFQWRGSPIRVGFNLQALASLGFQIDLLTLPIGEDRDIKGVNVIRVANPFGVKNIPIGPGLWKVFFDALIFFKGLRLCLTHRYDVVHGVEEAGFIGALLARLIKAKSIFEKHSDPFSYKKGFLKNCILKIYSGVEILAVKMVDAVIGTGPGLVEQVNAMNTTTRAFHIFDIPSSLEEASESAIAEARSTLLTSPDEVLITFVGSFAVYQGVDLMFAAIPNVVKQNRHARFIIIGGTDEQISQRKDLLSQQGVAESVTFLGKISPDILPNYLSASDILLSPRISGVNTPLKVLDYMKAGRAIAATDIPSNRLLLDESTAVLAAPEPAPFGQAISDLVGDAEKRTHMGVASRQLHETTYNFREYCRLLSECYAYVLTNEG